MTFTNLRWCQGKGHLADCGSEDMIHFLIIFLNHCLFFSLKQQKLIELIRDKDIEGALNYAQLHLAERVEENPDVLTELEKTLALLAFENPENSPFGELLHISQRQKVSKMAVSF